VSHYDIYQAHKQGYELKKRQDQSESRYYEPKLHNRVSQRGIENVEITESVEQT